MLNFLVCTVSSFRYDTGPQFIGYRMLKLVQSQPDLIHFSMYFGLQGDLYSTETSFYVTMCSFKSKKDLIIGFKFGIIVVSTSSSLRYWDN